MEIITSGRILYALSRKHPGFEYNRKFKYLTHTVPDGDIRRIVAPLGYVIRYFDGCFYPFLARIKA